MRGSLAAPGADGPAVSSDHAGAIKVRIARALGRPRVVKRYCLAATPFEFDLNLDTFAEFETKYFGTHVDAVEAPALRRFDPFYSVGTLGGQPHRIDVMPSTGTLILRIEQVGRFDINATAGSIELIETDATLDPTVFTEALLGPVVLIALALRGVWALHASAVRTPHGIVAFAGESGAGKSTVGAHLDGLGMERIADDILPLRARGRMVETLPQYPQFKLAPAERATRVGGPLARLIVLHGARSNQPVRPSKLNGASSLREIVASSVATRLLPPDVLRQHFDFIALACAAVEVYRTPYPHTQASLDAMHDLIATLSR